VAKISAVLPDELGVALEQRARAEDRSASAVVRRALVEHLTSPLGGQVVPTGSRALRQVAGAGASHPSAKTRGVDARPGRGIPEGT